MKFNFEAASGWTLNAPSDAAQREVLTAMYPALGARSEEQLAALASLDYLPPPVSDESGDQRSEDMNAEALDSG